jgi:transaldolase
VTELIGPETVNTMPMETISAFLDHGDVRRTLDRDLHAAHDAIHAVEANGVSMDQVTRELLDEGVEAFSKSFDDLIATIESKRSAMATA